MKQNCLRDWIHSEIRESKLWYSAKRLFVAATISKEDNQIIMRYSLSSGVASHESASYVLYRMEDT